MRKKTKVIFLEDVLGKGKKLDVKDVPLGYFRNYLLPNNLAELATDEVLQELEERRVREEEERKARVAVLKEKAKELAGTTLSFKAKTTNGKKIFGSVTARDIEAELEEKGFGSITVLLEEPLKKLGTHEVELDLGDGVKTSVKVEIEEEK